MNHWIKDFINLLYPPICHICGNSLAPHEKFICSHCIKALPRTGYHRKPDNPMEQRFAGQFPFVSATGHFFYARDTSLSQLIQDMKYRGFRDIGKFLGELAGTELFTSGFLSEIEYIVPVPMYFLKKAKRGYNQTDYIAEGISKVTDIPVLQALKMIRRRKTQTALTRIERLANADNLFAIKKAIDLSGKTILIVDDICTTGTTIAAAAKTITDSFPDSRLYLFTLGVTF